MTIRDEERCFFNHALNELVAILDEVDDDEANPLFTPPKLDEASFSELAVRRVQRIFQLLAEGYKIVRSVEHKISQLLRLAEDDIAQAYPDTGWPLPTAEPSEPPTSLLSEIEALAPLPLLLAVFCVAEAQHIAMYEDGRFLQDIGGAEFQRLSKAPETFELQYCKLSGVRSEVFNQLLSVVDADADDTRPADLIDVVRPLCKFAATLPDYAKQTTSLSKSALAVRDALMNATEPATLLFEELPAACGQPAISAGRRVKDDRVKKYVRALKKSLGELRSAYPKLLSWIEGQLAVAFETNANAEETRRRIQKQAKDLSLHVTEPTLKAFCLRIADEGLARDAWLESLGSLVIAKPPRRWLDRDESRFVEALSLLVKRFEDSLSLAFAKGESNATDSLRVSILQPNGEESSCVLQITSSDAKAARQIEKQMDRLFRENPKLAAAVASRILFKQLADEKK